MRTYIVVYLGYSENARFQPTQVGSLHAREFTVQSGFQFFTTPQRPQQSQGSPNIRKQKSSTLKGT